MKIKDVEEQTGIERASIRYYERLSYSQVDITSILNWHCTG